jgi:hypothetical protein
VSGTSTVLLALLAVFAEEMLRRGAGERGLLGTITNYEKTKHNENNNTINKLD